MEVENSEEMSSWKEAWENQVYQIHKSRTSEQLDTVKPGGLAIDVYIAIMNLVKFHFN